MQNLIQHFSWLGFLGWCLTMSSLWLLPAYGIYKYNITEVCDKFETFPHISKAHPMRRIGVEYDIFQGTFEETLRRKKCFTCFDEMKSRGRLRRGGERSLSQRRPCPPPPPKTLALQHLRFSLKTTINNNNNNKN